MACPRYLSMLKHSCVMLAIIILLVWIVSGLYYVQVGRLHGTSFAGIIVSGGSFQVQSALGPLPVPASRSQFIARIGRKYGASIGWTWLPFRGSALGYASTFDTVVGIPLYMPLLVTVMVMCLLIYADRQHIRRTQAQCCTHCGYDLRGICGTKSCPECGTHWDASRG